MYFFYMPAMGKFTFPSRFSLFQPTQSAREGSERVGPRKPMQSMKYLIKLQMKTLYNQHFQLPGYFISTSLKWIISQSMLMSNISS